MTEPDSALSFPQVYFPAGCQHIKSPGAFQGVLHFSQFGKSDIFFWFICFQHTAFYFGGQ